MTPEDFAIIGASLIGVSVSAFVVWWYTMRSVWIQHWREAQQRWAERRTERKAQAEERKAKREERRKKAEQARERQLHVAWYEVVPTLPKAGRCSWAAMARTTADAWMIGLYVPNNPQVYGSIQPDLGRYKVVLYQHHEYRYQLGWFDTPQEAATALLKHCRHCG